ncbi:MAG TPA: TnpV protein [Aestuariivirga sp.]|nr:TnpV protein [Aestuariivirga sp.]
MTAQAYAKLHRKFLTENNPGMLAEISKTSEGLAPYLQRIGEQAMEMYDHLSSQMQTSPNLPTDYAKRLEALQAIPLTVEEIVLDELIYQTRKSA